MQQITDPCSQPPTAPSSRRHSPAAKTNVRLILCEHRQINWITTDTRVLVDSTQIRNRCQRILHSAVRDATLPSRSLLPPPRIDQVAQANNRTGQCLHVRSQRMHQQVPGD